MKRKVIQLGRSTKIMTLPSKWIERYQLTANHELSVEEHGSSLIVTAPTSQNILELTINFQDRPTDDTLWDHLIWRRLVAAYVRGADHVTILYDLQDTFTEQKIEQYVSDLQGFTIIHKTKNNYIIQDLSPPQTKDIGEILKRIFFLLREMSDLAVNTITQRITNTSGALFSMETNLNRLSYLCLRIINRNGLFEYQKNNSIYRIITLLEEVGDQYRRIIHSYHKDNSSISKDIIGMMEFIQTLLNSIQQLYYYYSEKEAHKVYSMYKPLGTTLRQIQPQNKSEGIILAYLLQTRDLIKSIYEEIVVLYT